MLKKGFQKKPLFRTYLDILIVTSHVPTIQTVEYLLDLRTAETVLFPTLSSLISERSNANYISDADNELTIYLGPHTVTE